MTIVYICIPVSPNTFCLFLWIKMFLDMFPFKTKIKKVDYAEGWRRRRKRERRGEGIIG